MKSKKQQPNTLLRVILLAAIAIVGVLCLNNHRVYAMTLNNGDIPDQVQAGAYTDCQTTDFGIAQASWLSPDNNGVDDSSSNLTSETIPQGTTATMWWNVADYYCNTPVVLSKYRLPGNPFYDTQRVLYTSYNVYNVTPSGITGGSIATGAPSVDDTTCNPGQPPGCYGIGTTLTVAPTWDTDWSAIASKQFIIPAQTKSMVVNLIIWTQAINQFHAIPPDYNSVPEAEIFQCVGNKLVDGVKNGDWRSNLLNFNGNYDLSPDVPQSYLPEHPCETGQYGFTINLQYTDTIKGNVSTYSPLKGLIPKSGVDVYIYDTSNNDYAYEDTTDSSGNYSIAKVPFNDGYVVQIGASVNNNYYIDPGGGGVYDKTCSPNPTNPPWCPNDHYYQDQVAGGDSDYGLHGIILPYYNRGTDSGYDFVQPSFAIKGTKVQEVNGNLVSLSSNFAATVSVSGSTYNNNTTTNPFNFNSLPWIKGNYTVQADANYTDSSGTIYNLVGSVWCGTAACTPTPTDHPKTYAVKSSGTDSVSFAIPSNDAEVNVDLIYQKEVTTPTYNLLNVKMDTSGNWSNCIAAHAGDYNCADVNITPSPVNGQTSPTTANNFEWALVSGKPYNISAATPAGYTLKGYAICHYTTTVCDPGHSATSSGSSLTLTPSSNTVVHWIYEPVPVEIVSLKVDANNHTLGINFGAMVNISGIGSSRANSATFNNNINKGLTYPVNAQDSYTDSNGNSYVVVGSSWCQSLDPTPCTPSLSTTDPHWNAGDTNDVTTPSSGYPTVIHWEYQKQEKVSYHITGRDVDINNTKLAINPQITIGSSSLSDKSSYNNPFVFPTNDSYTLSPGVEYTVTAAISAKDTVNGNTYHLLASNWCSIPAGSTCTPTFNTTGSGYRNYQSGKYSGGHTNQVTIPTGGTVVIYWEYVPIYNLLNVKMDTNGDWSSTTPADYGDFNTALVDLTTKTPWAIAPVNGRTPPTDYNNFNWTLDGGAKYTVSVTTPKDYILTGYAICHYTPQKTECDPGHRATSSGSSLTLTPSSNTVIHWIYEPVEIISLKVDANNHTLGRNFSAMVSIPGIGNSRANPATFNNNVDEGQTYIVNAQDSYTDSNGNSYVVVGSSWCDSTSLTACTPSLTDHWHAGDTNDVNTPSPIGYPAVIHWQYQEVPACKNNIASVSTNDGNNYIGTGRQFKMDLGESGVAQPSAITDDSIEVNFSGPGNMTPGGGDISTGLSYSNGTITYSPLESADTPGSYSVTWQFSGPGITAKLCQATFNIANQPFFGVTNGDVYAGSGYETSCDQTADAGIFTWNSNDGFQPVDYTLGAGTNFAAQALGDIDGFTTQQFTTSTPGDALSFANSKVDNINLLTGELGGEFGTVPCAYDYDSDETASTPTHTGDNNLGDSIYSTGSYLYTGSLPLSGTIAANNQITVYVHGNVSIDNSRFDPKGITYAAAGGPTPSTITSFHLVATGDINIDSSVTQLDGVYVAQTGTIRTCADSSGNIEPAGNIESAGNCNKQLTVNGAFVAQTIKFWRTYGTMGTTSQVSHSPAEVFNYSPYIWLAIPEPNTPTNNYLDAISNLPPVL